MSKPSLSAGTRQCMCGGWTRFIVCQYCGATDPAYAAVGMVSTAPLTVPAVDADPAAVPPAPAADRAADEVSKPPDSGDRPTDGPAEVAVAATQPPARWKIPVLLLIVGAAALIAYVTLIGTGGSGGSTPTKTATGPSAVRPTSSASTSSTASSPPTTVHRSTVSGSALLTAKLPANFITAGVQAPVAVATTSLTRDMLTGGSSTGILTAHRYVTRRGNVSVTAMALQFTSSASAAVFAAGPHLVSSPWAVSNSRAGIYDWGNGLHSHAAIVANGPTAFILRAEGPSSTLFALNAYALALRP